MKTKKPIGLVYGWDKFGEFELISDVYFWEGLQDVVYVYSYESYEDFEEHYNKIQPDIIIQIGTPFATNNDSINKRIHFLETSVEDPVLANIIVCQATFRNSAGITPRFSVFTPTYMIADRIERTYQGLKNQTFTDWEWVVVDDSPEGDLTWEKLLEISKKDFRVKPHRILPNTGGVVGHAKNRAAHLCQGDWLVELDHDDYLLSEALEELDNASKAFPDAGFMYSEVCELYDDGQMKYYTEIWGEDGYANPNNGFNANFGIHYWINVDGVDYLSHRYSDINPLSIRYNWSMPNHVRVWKREVYLLLGGHNKRLPVADDYELIVRTFLVTPIIHVKKLLYLQYNNNNSTVDNNVIDINRRARLIKDYFDTAIHERILELGKEDWMWNEEDNRSYFQIHDKKKFFHQEQVMNYVYL